MTFISEEYINYFDKYARIYGRDKTLVFMQVGSFYESYATENEGPDLLVISKLLGIIRTRKNKQDTKISYKNPYFLGFPMVALIKFLEILLENDFIVVIVNQISNKKKLGDKKERREVTKIYSKGTYIENIDKKDGNYIVCIYISCDKQLDDNYLFSVGLTGVDVSTGRVYTHEAYSSKYDPHYSLDEVDRFINSLEPREINIYYNNHKKSVNKDIDKEFIFNYLKLNENSCRFYDKIDTKYFDLNFQNEMLKNVYTTSNTLVSPIEHLDLNKNIYIIISLVLMFDFIYEKNKTLLKSLCNPIHFISPKHLILGNNAIRQLDVLENTNQINKCKFRSLFHVINKTSTALGERFLKSRILSPLINITELNESYDYIEFMMRKDFYKKIETYLDNIKDVERLQRKMEMKILQPYELINLYMSYININDMIPILNKTCLNNLMNMKIMKQIKSFIEYIEEIFNLDELEKYSNLDFETFIFNDNIYEELDNLKIDIDFSNNFIHDLNVKLNELIDSKNGKFITIKKTDRDGYFLSTTNLRAKLLKEKLKNVETIMIGKSNKIEVRTSSLDFKDNGKTTKIYFLSMNNKFDNIDKYNIILQRLNKKCYLQELEEIYDTYKKLFIECNNFISKLDFIKSSAKVASLYGYNRPSLIEKEHGYIKANKIRHPIVERIIDHEYIPHDIELGDKIKGMMLFSINAIGKSCLMKSIGLNVIMAQSGMFVASEKFILSPYTSIYARITSDDNLFRGLSSFTLEMVELNAILNRSDKHTLVIGDEVCRGTEHVSGTSIVASTILKLAENESSFIFATHLHELTKLKAINELKNVKPYHLSVQMDEKTGKLIYDRKLKEGSGESLYGITVAQHIIQNKDFIDTANKIKNELMNTFDTIMPNKKSSYNSSVYIYKCDICDTNIINNGHISNLETHHINFQKDCDEKGFVKNKKHIQKNHKSNLSVVCNKCHDSIHNGSIKLKGYVMTSEGRKLMKH